MRARRICIVLAVGVASACAYDWTADPACRASSECGADQICVFPDAQCGQGVAGRCRPVPPTTSCAEKELDLLCGCSGRLHKHPCQANAFGDDVAFAERCQPFEFDDLTACGTRICEPHQRCEPGPDAGLSARCVPR